MSYLKYRKKGKSASCFS